MALPLADGAFGCYVVIARLGESKIGRPLQEGRSV